MDWTAFQACLEGRLPGNPFVIAEETTDNFAEELTSAVHEATATSAPRCRSLADPRPSLPASIVVETRLKNRLRRQWQITTDPVLKGQIKRLQMSVTYQLNEWWND
jgi:hypothetical protein